MNNIQFEKLGFKIINKKAGTEINKGTWYKAISKNLAIAINGDTENELPDEFGPYSIELYSFITFDKKDKKSIKKKTSSLGFAYICGNWMKNNKCEDDYLMSVLTAIENYGKKLSRKKKPT